MHPGQAVLSPTEPSFEVPDPLRRAQLLKWVGSKQRYASQICNSFPQHFDRYFEPFLGSGAVLGTLAPPHGVGSDQFAPLVSIWQTLSAEPELVKHWYRQRYDDYMSVSDVDQRKEVYERIKSSYNAAPNGADFLFLCRACYAGIVRFRRRDGYMSTPCGPHKPISPETFGARVDLWAARTSGTHFRLCDYREVLAEAGRGDLVYCDPPYSYSQGILYGAQGFRLNELFDAIASAKARGARVVLSIDGSKKSGNTVCATPLPDGVFVAEWTIDCGGSMLRRLQGASSLGEAVADRLLMTYKPG